MKCFLNKKTHSSQVACDEPKNFENVHQKYSSENGIDANDEKDQDSSCNSAVSAYSCGDPPEVSTPSIDIANDKFKTDANLSTSNVQPSSNSIEHFNRHKHRRKSPERSNDNKGYSPSRHRCSRSRERDYYRNKKSSTHSRRRSRS